LLRRMRRQRLSNITILPSLITILNGVCGFSAIFFASKGIMAGADNFAYHKLQLPYFALAGYMILVAMIADMLDGRLARMSQSTSSFGGQLDSLCDVISFGVAPAFLMVKMLEYKLTEFAEFGAVLESFIGRFVWLTAAAYLSCSAIRLARFNVENEEDESAHMSFVGLPTPAAAGVIVSLVIFHQELLSKADGGSEASVFFGNTILYLLPFLALGVGILMVSRIRYPHIVNQYIKGKKPFAHLIRILLFLAVVIWSRQAALVVIFCGFAASGFVRWAYHKILRKNTLEPTADMCISNGNGINE